MRKFTRDFYRFRTYDSQYLQAAVLEIESTRDLTRVGVIYTCKGGWDSAKAEAASAKFPNKLKQIRRLTGSAAAKSQLDNLLKCGYM